MKARKYIIIILCLIALYAVTDIIYKWPYSYPEGFSENAVISNIRIFRPHRHDDEMIEIKGEEIDRETQKRIFELMSSQKYERERLLHSYSAVSEDERIMYISYYNDESDWYVEFPYTMTLCNDLDYMGIELEKDGIFYPESVSGKEMFAEIEEMLGSVLNADS